MHARSPGARAFSWSSPRAEEAQICVQGNLEADKKEFSVGRVCHLHFGHIEVRGAQGEDFMVAIGLLKNSNKRIRTPPIPFKSKNFHLNLTFSFQYLHQLKGPSEPNTIRVMFQQRIKKQYKTFAQGLINLSDILHAGRQEINLSIKSVQKLGEPGLDFAYLFGSVGTYPEDVETVEDAVEWEQFFEEPRIWSIVDTDSGKSSFTDSDDPMVMTELPGEENPILSEQLREMAQKTKVTDLSEERKDGSAAQPTRRGKIAKVSKLFSASRHSRSVSAKMDDKEVNDFQPELELFETNYPAETHRRGSEDEGESEIGSPVPKEEAKKRKIPGDKYFNAEELQHIENDLFVFIKTSKKQGKRLELLAKKKGGMLQNFVSVNCFLDMELSMQQIIEKYERRSATDEQTKFKILIAGNDSFVNTFVRVFISLFSDKSRCWILDAIRFYLIPIGITVDIARQIASTDSIYRALFFSVEWERFFRNNTDEFSRGWFGGLDFLSVGTYVDIIDEGQEIFNRISRYVSESTEIQTFEVGEAFITRVNQNSQQETVKIPFIKEVKFGAITSERREKETESGLESVPDEFELQLDYWTSKKKEKDTQASIKGLFTGVGIARLPGMCSLWRMDPQHRPSSSTFAMALHYSNKKRGFVKATVAKAGIKSESSRMQTVHSKISKLTCSLCNSDNESLSFLIDGVEWKRIKFLSVSPQWGMHVKSLPICIFENTQRI